MPSANPPAPPRLCQDGSQVAGSPQLSTTVAGRLVGPVVDDDQVGDRMGLLGERGERVGQRLGAVPRDDHRDDGSGRERSGIHRASISASTSRPL